MSQRNRSSKLVAATILALLPASLAGTAGAAELRYHYAPVNACGPTTSLKPSGPEGAAGTRVTWLGFYSEPYNAPVRATHMVTFRHPYTNRDVTVPIAFPQGTPRIEHRRDRIIFAYGTYSVEARFTPDGSVDVVYNSGLLRPL